MKILPKRSMRLGGKDVQAGKPAEVSKEDGELAIRHGWAVLYDKDAAKAAEAKAAEAKAKAEAEEKAKVEAEAKAKAEAEEKAKVEAEAKAKAEAEEKAKGNK
jgi:membrane protein involved in colicin uptake